MAEQQPARRRPGDRHLDADVAGDAEGAGRIPAIQHHVFVAAQAAELHRLTGLGGELIHGLQDAPVVGVVVAVGPAVEVHRPAEIDVAFGADRLQHLRVEQAVDDLVGRRTRRADLLAMSPTRIGSRCFRSASSSITTRSMPRLRSPPRTPPSSWCPSAITSVIDTPSRSLRRLWLRGVLSAVKTATSIRLSDIQTVCPIYRTKTRPRTRGTPAPADPPGRPDEKPLATGGGRRTGSSTRGTQP